MPTRHLTLLDVLALHEEAMLQSGDLPQALREPGLLESAVARPQMVEAYEGADLPHQAALLIAGISQAQAFLEGNKRTALFCGELFLRVNGFRMVDTMAVAQHIVALAERRAPRDAAERMLAQYLRDTCVPVEP